MRHPRPACDHAGTMVRDHTTGRSECTACRTVWQRTDQGHKLVPYVDPIDEIAS